MKADWLVVQSFQRNQDLLLATNTLLIHLKLKLSGHEDSARIESVIETKNTLKSFFEEFDKIIKQTEESGARPILGVGPRLRQLAKSFLSAKKDKKRFKSVLFSHSISEMLRLLESQNKQDQEKLINCLEEFRVLLEEHAYADTTRVLGEI